MNVREENWNVNKKNLSAAHEIFFSLFVFLFEERKLTKQTRYVVNFYCSPQ